MTTKVLTPKQHSLIDYALVGCLLVLPTALGLKKKARKIYAAEAAALLVYVSLTDSPVAVKPLIPFPLHGKIDPFNVGQFALQSFFGPFKKDKKTLLFNIAFTAAAGLTVLFTNWNGPTK